MHYRACFLFALLFTAALSAGCGKGPRSVTEVAAAYEHDVVRRIKRNVKDEARKDALLALEAEVDMCLLNIEQLYVETEKQFRVTPAPSPEARAEAAAALSEARKQQLLDIGRLRMEMRRIASPDEWQRIFAPE